MTERDLEPSPAVRAWGPRELWTVPSNLRRQAECRPDALFLQIDHGPYATFGEVLHESEDVAACLAGAGLAPGSRALVMMATSHDAVRVWLGINLLASSEVALNTAYRGQTLAHAINLSQAKIMVVDAEFVARVHACESELLFLETLIVAGDRCPQIDFDRIDLVAMETLPHLDFGSPEVAFSDETSVLFTSGTTGPAKGVMIPHAQTYAIARQTGHALRLTSDDVMYGFTPLFHMGGKHSLLYTALVAGCRLVLDRAFDAERWLPRVRETGATVAMGHGPLLEMIFAVPSRADDQNNSLRVVAACPLPAGIAAEFESRFGVRGVETWGMTEVNTPIWAEIDEPLRPGVAGRPLRDLYEVVLVDPTTDIPVPTGQVGEITVRSFDPWLLMQGYLNMPEETVKAWRNLRFHTGDAGYFDDLGDLHFVDRMGDRIRRRSENIAAYDVEVVALAFEHVVDAAAIPVPSELSDDDEIKLVVTQSSDSTIAHQDLFEHMVRGLPHYMVPRYIEVVGDMPRSATNKIQKKVLRDQGNGTATWDYKEAGLSIREITESQATFPSEPAGSRVGAAANRRVL